MYSNMFKVVKKVENWGPTKPLFLKKSDETELVCTRNWVIGHGSFGPYNVGMDQLK